jgi:hypothetical protein
MDHSHDFLQNLIDGFENATSTFVSFTRLLDTGDSLDTPITNAPMYILWALNPSDGTFSNGFWTFSQHTQKGAERTPFLSFSH